MTVSHLRQQYPEFRYTSSKWHREHNQLVAEFHYRASEFDFQHRMLLPIHNESFDGLDTILLDKLVFSLGMVEALSYWKAFCSPTIKVEAGSLTSWQLQWWHNLLLQGMGEYFYVNDIDFTQEKFVSIVSKDENNTAKEPEFETGNTHTVIPDNQTTVRKILIPLGGGKDSIVTTELLKQHQAQDPEVELSVLLINPTDAARAVASHSQLPTLTVTRILDPKLLDLNARGFLNGHVPFSATIAFIATLTAYLNQHDAVALSNEASANEPSLMYRNHPINHQYSKSFAFEQDFADYCLSLIKSNNRPKASITFPHPLLPTYFSFLRPLTELQIARLFATVGQPYFTLFKSCNRGSKTNTWCGQCAKCLFTYLLLSPFIDPDTLTTIFSQNLLEKPELLPTLHALIGVTADKPLDCVGLREESLIASRLTIEQYQAAHQPLPLLLSAIKPILESELNLPERTQALLESWNSEHLIPPHLEHPFKSLLYS